MTTACVECGNDDPTQGYAVCSDCLELLGHEGDLYRLKGRPMGGASPARAGIRFEYDVKHHLEDLGWFVIRAAGSHGPADLVALRADHQPWLVSCKRTLTPRLRPAEWEQLYKAAVDVCAVPILVYKPGYGAARQGRGLEWRMLLGPHRDLTNLTRTNPT